MKDAPSPQSESAWWRWAGIMTFVGLPWPLIYLLVAFGENLPSEATIKNALFRSRPVIDTVVVGDSRVMRLGEEEFSAKGWAFFNMGLSGMSPEDVALQLRYAFAGATIRRVIMGVSFEDMTERFPFEHSRYWKEPVFANPEFVSFAGGPPAMTNDGGGGLWLRALVHRYILPFDGAAPRFHMALARLGVKNLPDVLLPNGNAAYAVVQKEIVRGAYDFRHNRDPAIYFSRSDGEARYIQTRALSKSALALYRKMFAFLSDSQVPCVAFETGRTPEYQALLDTNPLLVQLQSEWRDFFRAQRNSCVDFIEASSIDYAANDFFDAVHYVGPTEHRVAARMVDSLTKLETTCSKPH